MLVLSDKKEALKELRVKFTTQEKALDKAKKGIIAKISWLFFFLKGYFKGRYVYKFNNWLLPKSRSIYIYMYIYIYKINRVGILLNKKQDQPDAFFLERYKIKNPQIKLKRKSWMYISR